MCCVAFTNVDRHCVRLAIHDFPLQDPAPQQDRSSDSMDDTVPFCAVACVAAVTEDGGEEFGSQILTPSTEDNRSKVSINPMLDDQKNVPSTGDSARVCGCVNVLAWPHHIGRS
ncbi:hypothetical protein ElyMa_002882600 [Elysia marginata]|uniref:Uncharacterized protein n=1 Tax=Elysia marginata TaxID=1093978 RepID=A0AAV4I3F7_9GAST|nr:hypothetical protein ElyMa_002882600 [Elysia marginata]